MSRRYTDAVDVRITAAGAAPTAFVWRSRLYIVQAVLGHWRERRAWWAGAAARGVHGESTHLEGTDVLERVAGQLVGQGDEQGDEQARAALRRAALAEEQEIWRVEASRGRVHGVGVYELGHCLPGPWRLLRVGD